VKESPNGTPFVSIRLVRIAKDDVEEHVDLEDLSLAIALKPGPNALSACISEPERSALKDDTNTSRSDTNVAKSGENIVGSITVNIDTTEKYDIAVFIVVKVHVIDSSGLTNVLSEYTNSPEKSITKGSTSA